VYGEPRAQDRHLMWELLHRLKNSCHDQWLLLGDFNEVMWHFEHFSTSHRPERQILDFCEVLSHYVLHDLGFTGLPWTYDNMQKGKRNVCARMDRVVASPGWKHLFPSARLQHIVSSRSDHYPILLELEKEQNLMPPRTFRYKITWEREESLQEEIKTSWVSGGQVQSLGDVSCTLNKVRSSLKQWSAATFSLVTKELRRIRERMKEISEFPSDDQQDELHDLRLRMDEILYREEMMWLQCSRIA
jgi:hypothetical protein